MATLYSPKVVTDGLVLYLDAGNTKSYPGTGTAWTDLTPNSNNATLVNGPTFSGTNNGVITTDSTDDYITVSDSTSLQVTTGFTVGIWVKFNNTIGSYYRTLIGKPAYTKYGIIVEWYGNNPLLADFISSGNRNTGPGLVYPSLTNWNYVVHSYDKNGGTNNQRFHVWYPGTYSSAYATPGALNVDTSTESLNIGGAGLGLTIGSAWVYNRGLTNTEVLQNFNATRGRFGL